MIKIQIEQYSEAWFNVRLGRFTAIRFQSVVAGKSTKAYQDLITDIAGEIISEVVEETFTNAIMERGKELEPFARKDYAELYGDVEECGFIIPDEDDEFHEWIGISPDGLIKNGGLEIKCPLRKAHMNYIEKNVLPNEHKWQVQGSLFVSKLDFWVFMSWYPNMKPFLIRCLPDLEMHNNLKERLRIAIQDVKEKIKIYNNYNYEKTKLL